ncbi:hypothetical protein BJ165DRAFT_1468854 [Panaeolus papilionaceus]|nr:hypothetical protein BJ165DRAFT_1468854 [Panaeolus papilionaceus]
MKEGVSASPPPNDGEQLPPFVAEAPSSHTSVHGSLKDVQNQLAIYSNTLYDSAANALNPFCDPAQQPIQLPQDPPQDLTLAAENVARALEDLANSQASPQERNKYLRKAKKFRKMARLPKEKQRGVFREIGRGFFLIIIAPVAMAGMALYVTGVMLEGTGLILKGVGHQGKRLFRLDRNKDW